MPTEPIKPVKKRDVQREERPSALPALSRMQRLSEDRMMRSGEAVNRLPRELIGAPYPHRKD